MEVTIAMLISAIAISICYTAYEIIGSYYKTFQEKNKVADNVLSLIHIMERDFLRSSHILNNNDGLAIDQDSLTVYYVFKDDVILRRMSELHTDTFDLKHHGIKFFFEGTEVIEADTVDQVKLDLELDKKETVTIQLFKHYSAKDLF